MADEQDEEPFNSHNVRTVQTKVYWALSITGATCLYSFTVKLEKPTNFVLEKYFYDLKF
jgi:hypothetical protein